MPRNIGNNSDISKNTHCLPQNTNPPRGRGSYCSHLLFKRQLGIKNDTQNLQLSDYLHNRTINHQIGEQRLNRSRTRNKLPLVLFGFTNIPHLQHQSLIRAKSSFNDAASDDLSRGCGILQSKVESSALPTSSFWSSPGRSAMYNKNNNGPRTLPCGTSDTTSTLELHTPSLTFWVRLDKKFWNTFKIIPPTPASHNLNVRPPWLTLSKAALKSIWTSASSPPLSLPTDQHRRCPEEHHRYPNSFCMSTGEMTGPQISPKSDQNAKRSTSQNLRQNWCNQNRLIVADKLR